MTERRVLTDNEIRFETFHCHYSIFLQFTREIASLRIGRMREGENELGRGIFCPGKGNLSQEAAVKRAILLCMRMAWVWWHWL